ncbi:MAG: hypothetical protein NXI12_09640 [Alphaproteobacteria bacterium]|nr:hypothetical protein [Alphaproteobacteria bacterium]
MLFGAQTRIIIVGERHGTQQLPDFFGELVCRMSESGPVIVGLEMEADEQEALDAFLASDGSRGAVQTLLDSRHWALTDGRASVAMLDLLIRLRDLREAGRDIELAAFMHPADSSQARERAMAQALTTALERNPEARVAALIGKVHAERERLSGLAPAASFLPEPETLTISYVPWELCRRRSRCGAFLQEPRYRIVADPPAEWRWPVYDFWYAVGEPLTSSPLARDEQEESRQR